MNLRRRGWGAAALLAAPLWLLPAGLSEGGTRAGPRLVDAALLTPADRHSSNSLRSLDLLVEQALAEPPGDRSAISDGRR